MAYDGKIMRRARERFEADKARRAAALEEKRHRIYTTIPRVEEIDSDLRTTLSRIITKGLQKTGRIVQISTKLTDKAGNLAQLLSCVAETGANVLDIAHEREDAKTEVNSCVVTMTLETRDAEHVRKIRDELMRRGYRLLD